MFVDYLTLMLINMSAGFFLLACFVLGGLRTDNGKKWVAPFAIVGFVATVTGLHMIWNWPLPKAYNSAYGETSVLLGVLFLGAALAIAKEWDLLPLGIYAFFAGAAAVVLGARIIHLGMTTTPLLAGIGFILSGLGGICAAPVYYLRKWRLVRVVAATVLILVTLMWTRTACLAYWGHMQSFSKWVTPVMR